MEEESTKTLLENNQPSKRFTSFQDKSGVDDEIIFRLFELKNQNFELKEISDELQVSEHQIKVIFKQKMMSYIECPEQLEQEKLYPFIQNESNFLVNFCLENLENLCRFCFRLRSSTKLQKIFDESSDDHINKSIELIEKINNTLKENVFDKIECKFSNQICQACSLKIFELHAFKEQCNRNTDILLRVKKEIDKIQMISEEKLESELSSECEEEKESCEQKEISEQDEILVVLNEKRSSKPKKIRTSNDPDEEKSKKSYKGKNSICPICGKIVKGIQMHLLIHSGLKKHVCSYCPKSFTQSGQLKRHINSHLNIRNFSCPHSGCERTFVDPSSVTKHLVVHNKDDRKFICALCGSRFNRLGALRYHEKVHRQERTHCCSICNKSFLAKYDLTKHYRTHTGEKPYSCPFCDKKFSISKNAKVHLRVHTKEKPYDCKFCGLSFAYRSSVKNHLMKIHNYVSDSANFQQSNFNIMQSDFNQNQTIAVDIL